MRIAQHVLAAAVLLAALSVCHASAAPAPDAPSLLSPGFHPLSCPSASQTASLCGRAYYPAYLSASNASLLLSLATSAFELTPGGRGPVTIVDLVSGALSYDDQFVSLFALLAKRRTSLPLPAVHLYRSLVRQLSRRVAAALRVSERLYLTRPSFFSRIRSEAAASLHDEYWHVHVDRQQYGTFEATALLYLSDWAADFDGGEFAFVDSAAASSATDGEQRQVELRAAVAEAETGTAAASAIASGSSGGSELVVRPSLGALSFFSSGPENAHYVRPVTRGTRYALTVAFTRNEEDSVEAVLDQLYGSHIAEWQASNDAEAAEEDNS